MFRRQVYICALKHGDFLKVRIQFVNVLPFILQDYVRNRFYNKNRTEACVKCNF